MPLKSAPLILQTLRYCQICHCSSTHNLKVNLTYRVSRPLNRSVLSSVKWGCYKFVSKHVVVRRAYKLSHYFVLEKFYGRLGVCKKCIV